MTVLKTISVLIVGFGLSGSSPADDTLAEIQRQFFRQPRLLPSWLSVYERDAVSIFEHLTKGSGRGVGFDWLANVTDTFGHRKVGSTGLEDAIDYVVATTRSQGFDNAHAENVPDLPNWIRGEESAELLTPRYQKLSILAVGGSVAGDVTAEAIVVRSFAELDERAADVHGKIVVLNEEWLGSYGKTVAYRKAADRAAAHGALAVLARSVSPHSLYTPHTGEGAYSGAVASIPSACVTAEEAAMLWRMQRRGQRLTIRLLLTSRTSGTVTSRNTIFELRGTEKPEEVVLLSGHFDSWDVGQGAVDDGGGCAVMWNAVNALKALSLRPKRTIRVAFWTAEEPGVLGSRHYYRTHKHDNMFFVAESDNGVFKPESWNAKLSVAGNDSVYGKLDDIVALVNSLGVPLSTGRTAGASLEDVAFWAQRGVPGVQYSTGRPDNYYFNFHHSNADYVSAYQPEDLDVVSGVFGIVAHVVANMDSW